MDVMDVTTDDSFRSFLPGMAQEDDKALIVEFFVAKKLLGLKSTEAGREIYEDREYVRITVKGQDKQQVVEEVKPHHRSKYPVSYQMFQLQKPAPVVGTPIEQMPGIGPSMAHHLKGINLRSIEDLSNVSDEATFSRIGMGARDLVSRAKAFIGQSTDKAVALEQENRELKGQLTQVSDQMAAMQRQIAELAAAGKPKRKYTRRNKAKRAKAATQEDDGGQP